MEGASARQILAENLRIIRLLRNLSQDDIAALAGLDRGYVSGVERAQRNISLDNIEKLARGLDVRVEELLTRADRKQTAEQLAESIRILIEKPYRKGR